MAAEEFIIAVLMSTITTSGIPTVAPKTSAAYIAKVQKK